MGGLRLRSAAVAAPPAAVTRAAMRARLIASAVVLAGREPRQARDRDHRGIVGAELDARIVHACARGAPTAAVSRARSARLALTPPETTSACGRSPPAPAATWRSACRRSHPRPPRATSARSCAVSVPAAHRVQHRGLQAREAELEPRAIEHRAAGTRMPRRAPAQRARASCGPPGYGSPSSFAVLSKASPAASSRLAPSTR